MFQLVLLLTQQMCLYLVIAYLASKTPQFRLFAETARRLPHRIFIYIIFSGFCIVATYSGEQTNDAIANTRAMGAVLGGLLGGPATGFLVGLTGGLHRYSLGGFTDLACAISTTFEGLSAGVFSLYLHRKDRGEWVYSPFIVGAFTLFVESVQMLIILLVAKPFSHALVLVEQIAVPMLLVNSIGAALFMSMIRDQKSLYDKLSSTFSTQALKIAERCVGLLAKGLTPESCQKIAEIIKQETQVGAVAITNEKTLLAFVGIGAGHHLPGRPISSPMTLEAIAENKVMFADGVNVNYACSISKDCRLGSSLVIPLRYETEVIGTIKLYEPQNKLFLNINKTLGEGIGRLLSNQLLFGRYQEQHNLLVQSELKLLQAQVNPHFLFNALNTIAAVTAKDAPLARTLIQQLSSFLRINLKRTTGLVSLAEELEHVQAYLSIEKARFQDALTVDIDVDESLLAIKIPAFTLQPIIENAIKHGTSQLLTPGLVQVKARKKGDNVELVVRDNAGLYYDQKANQGLGMSIVHKRIQNIFGNQFCVEVQCDRDVSTQVMINVPASGGKHD